MKIHFYTFFLLITIILIKAQADDCETLFKIDGNKCGQLCLSSTIATFAIKFGGVTKGTCDNEGYKIFDHSEQISVGPFGRFEVKIYKKQNSAEA